MKRAVRHIGLLILFAAMPLLSSATAGSAYNEPDDLCMDGVLIFHEDFGGNNPEDPEYSSASVPGMDPKYSNAGNGSMGSFRYMIRKKGWKNGIQWHLQDDHTHFGDYTRGYLLEVDGGGGSMPFYSTTINDLAAGAKLTFSAYVVNITYAGQIPYLQKNYGYIYPRLRFVFKDPDTGEIIASKSTGNIQPDATKVWDINLSESADWQLVGMTFTVPDGITRAELAIYNDVVGNGSGNDFALDDIEVRLCMPSVSILSVDTVVCDTLMPVSWRKHLWQQIGTVIDTLRDFEHDDSVYVHLTLSTQKCCPDIRREPVQLWEICDTLMPYTWFFRDTALVFTDVSDVHYVEIPHPRWDCTDSIYILRLDTVHCEKLWPIIVHKYNRVLLLDNVRFRQFFPDHTILSLQWYRDEQPIPDATKDDYSEQDELHGRFQLFIRMDGDEHAWSNIIELLDTTAPLPVTKRVYNNMGLPVREDLMPRGVYLIYYEQGNNCWTEKKIVL